MYIANLFSFFTALLHAISFPVGLFIPSFKRFFISVGLCRVGVGLCRVSAGLVQG